MKIGQKVMLICQECDDGLLWPPIGAIGFIHTPLDFYDDYDVMFEEYPCPVCLPDESWIVHKTWVIPIDDNKTEEKLRCIQYESN